MAQRDRKADPTTSTIKKLFSYSGNQCAMPKCTNELVHEKGTLLGKIAHIHAVSPGGARYKEMPYSKIRDFNNLMIVCSICHDLIDDKNNENEYPADLLKKYKKNHEKRFIKAEELFVEEFIDRTQSVTPTYPQNLKALAKALGVAEIENNEEEIKSIHNFVNKLKEVPQIQRNFALALSERMLRNNKQELLIADVTHALGISQNKLKTHMEVLEDHKIGDISEGKHTYLHTVKIYDRAIYTVNPFIEIILFCNANKLDTNEFLYNLNFRLYDSLR